MREEQVENNLLETELQTSEIIQGVLYPAPYTNLRNNLSKIKPIQEIEIDYLPLMKILFDKKGFLKDSEVEHFWYGNNVKLLQELTKLQTTLQDAISFFNVAIPNQIIAIQNELSNKMVGQDVVGLSQAIDSVQYNNMIIDSKQVTLNALKIQEGVINAIIEAYGLSSQRLKHKKNIVPSLSPNYKVYLNELSTNISEYVENIETSMVLGRVLDSIITTLPPPNNLDTFKKEEVENLLKVLSHPKEFYTFCRLQEIISPLVGTLFGHCYPGFYHMFLDMYLDDYEKMNYQEQINFRKCFGLDENNSQLITLCSNYINRDFNPQGATI